MKANPHHRNAYIMLANLTSMALKLQDAVKTADKAQLDSICKQASMAMQFLSVVDLK